MRLLFNYLFAAIILLARAPLDAIVHAIEVAWSAASPRASPYPQAVREFASIEDVGRDDPAPVRAFTARLAARIAGDRMTHPAAMRMAA